MAPGHGRLCDDCGGRSGRRDRGADGEPANRKSCEPAPFGHLVCAIFRDHLRRMRVALLGGSPMRGYRASSRRQFRHRPQAAMQAVQRTRQCSGEQRDGRGLQAPGNASSAARPGCGQWSEGRRRNPATGRGIQGSVSSRRCRSDGRRFRSAIAHGRSPTSAPACGRTAAPHCQIGAATAAGCCGPTSASATSAAGGHRTGAAARCLSAFSAADCVPAVTQ